MPRRVLRSKPALLAAAVLLAGTVPTAGAAEAAVAAVAAPGEPEAACAADDTTVVVDFNELGGGEQSVCVPGGGTAAQLFHRAGFPTEEARGTALQGFVCRVAGEPASGPCTGGDAYWSLWWSEPGTEPDWAYATLGADQLDVAPGSWIGFAWHEGDGAAAPPDVAVATTPDPADPDATRAAEEAADDGVDGGDDGGGLPWWPLLGAAVVLAAAALVPIRRARS